MQSQSECVLLSVHTYYSILYVISISPSLVGGGTCDANCRESVACANCARLVIDTGGTKFESLQWLLKAKIGGRDVQHMQAVVQIAFNWFNGLIAPTHD